MKRGVRCTRVRGKAVSLRRVIHGDTRTGHDGFFTPAMALLEILMERAGARVGRAVVASARTKVRATRAIHLCK